MSEQKVCEFCGAAFLPRVRASQRYCSKKCRWTRMNGKRVLKPNVAYDCTVCGKHVERWVAPSRHAVDALSYCSRMCKGKALSGERHHFWKGGRRVNDQGYVLIHTPAHPYADRQGYVREHRLVMERKIGRYLRPEEVVHHVNAETQDNRPENLELFANNAAHKAHEYAARKRDEAGRLLPLESAS